MPLRVTADHRAEASCGAACSDAPDNLLDNDPFTVIYLDLDYFVLDFSIPALQLRIIEETLPP